MRRVIRFDVDAVRPARTNVLTRLGVPKDAPVPPAVADLLRNAEEALASSAEPRGVIAPVTGDEFSRVFRSEGRNAAECPLDLIAPRAEALALFVGTIGDKTGREIDRMFRAGDPALAMFLDAFASEATTRVAEALAAEFLAYLRNDAAANDRTRVLPYSPGYCGWHLTGQRAIFASVSPDDIGVALEPSCLMVPIKSVSGVLVAGDASVHRFRPAWAFCDECETRDCGPRMVSVRS